jgi:hypothetical protein
VNPHRDDAGASGGKPPVGRPAQPAVTVGNGLGATATATGSGNASGGFQGLPLALAGAGLRMSLALSGGGIRSASVSSGVLCQLHGLGLDTCVDALSCVSGGGYVGSSYTVARAQATEHASAAATAIASGPGPSGTERTPGPPADSLSHASTAATGSGWAQEYFQNFFDHGGYLCNFAPMRGRGPHGEAEGGRPGEGGSRLLYGLRDIVFFFVFFGVTTALSMVVFLAPAIIWVRCYVQAVVITLPVVSGWGVP